MRQGWFARVGVVVNNENSHFGNRWHFHARHLGGRQFNILWKDCRNRKHDDKGAALTLPRTIGADSSAMRVNMDTTRELFGTILYTQ